MIPFALVPILATGSVSLEWKPYLEPTLTYDFKRSGTFGAVEGDIEMTLTRQVLGDSKANAIHMKETLVMVGQRTGAFDSEPTHPQRPFTKSWQLTRKSNGEWLSYDSPKEPHWPDSDAISDPLIDIVYPEKPVQKGEKWSYHNTDATTDRNTEFTYLGTEKVGRRTCNKVAVVLRAPLLSGQGQTSGSGTFWLDPKDGAIVKSDLQMNEHDASAFKVHEIISRKA